MTCPERIGGRDARARCDELNGPESKRRQELYQTAIAF
jgi:hypothetical protein